MPSRRTVAARATCGVGQPGLVERGNLDEFRQLDALDQKLGNSVTAIDHDRFGGVEVDQRHLDLAAVAGINGTRTVDDRKPHARSQSRPGMDEADHSFRYRHRNPGGHQRALPRCQQDVDRAVQIDPRITGMRANRQRQITIQAYDRQTSGHDP